MDKNEFIDKIFNVSGKSTLMSRVVMVKEKSGHIENDLFELLNLDKNRLTEEGQLLLEILENDENFPLRKKYQKFKSKILSFVNIQDIFPNIIFDDYTDKALFAQYYFYYEALHILREYLYSGFNNCQIAANHLLRTFFEFNIRQCYFFKICENQNSFKPLQKYLKDGITPSNQNMVNLIFPKDAFHKPIKKKIQTILKGLSNSSSHAFQPADSARGNGKYHFEYSLDTLLFWVSLDFFITSIQWMYFAIFPMLLFPKNGIQKWGFSGPMGVFSSDYNFRVLELSCSSNDLKTFQAYHEKTEEVQALFEYYDSLDDLSEEEIKDTWTEEQEYPEETGAYLHTVAKSRAIKEFAANQCTVEANNRPHNPAAEKLINEMETLEFWKKNYKKM